MRNLTLSALTVFAGGIYYSQVGPALLPVLMLFGGGIWLLVEIIRVARQTS